MIDSSYMSEFTFEREWAERRGLLLVLAFFLGGLGGGLYLVSSYFHFYTGMVVAFFVVAIGKGGAHFLYLGRPLRFWRAFLRPQTSWISRGIMAVVGFVIFTALQLAPTVPFLSGLPWTADNAVLQVLATASAIVLIAYTGFALGVVNAIPFWNTALMPLLFIVYSLLGGAGLALGLVAGMGGPAALLGALESGVRVMLLIAATMLAVYLWLSYHVNPAAKFSVTQVIRGRVSPYFIGGVVVLGLVVPAVVGILSFVSSSSALIVAGAASELIGGFCLRYSIMKAGVYAPIV
ncbi:MAG: polysulfide reductase NrfD [Chloroflexi bacterium]|nr:polysulfide reductase NrfD [Chloroflexota bacterium]